MNSAIKPSLSVIVPFFNAGRHLDACLASLSAQTFEDREVILIDDGSTDDSLGIAEGWLLRDRTFRLLRQPHSGAGAARALGVTQSEGLYVGFVDSDDLIAPEMFSTLMELAVTNSAEVVQVGFRFVHPNSKRSRIYNDRLVIKRHQRISAICDAERKTLLHSRPAVWRYIYLREFLQRHNIKFNKSLKYYDDCAFQFEVMAKVERFIASPKVQYFYNSSVSNQITSFDDKRVFEHFKMFRYLRDRFGAQPETYLHKVLQRVELDSHLWSLSLLKRELRADYRRKIAQEFFGSGSINHSLKILTNIIAYLPRRGPAVMKSIHWWLLYLIARVRERDAV